jgi:6-phosphofructokinase 2
LKIIVTITMNPAIDTGSSVVHVIPERKLSCSIPRHEPGGGGINVSRAIKKLGGESLALYPAGGSYGQMLRNLLDAEGLNHHLVPINGSTRENFTIFEESSGQQFRFGMPGPPIQDAELELILEVLTTIDPKPDYIVASGSLTPGVPKDFYANMARIAKELNARTIVDTSGEGLQAAVRAGVYLLKPNMNELRTLAKQEIKDESQQVEVARGIIENGQSEIVVVSLGAAGALMVSKEGCERFRAPIVPIRSKVGAGDSMLAGIVLSLAQGKSMQDAVRFGIAAGSAAVMTPGTELCRREDTERLYERMISDNSKHFNKN